jgi:hypothetical protein
LKKSCSTKNSSYLLSTKFQKIGSLFVKELVEDKIYQPLFVYGQAIHKKNLDLEIEEWKTPLMKIMLLHFIQRKEEDSKQTSDKHLEMRSLHQPQVIIKEEMFHRFGALDMKTMGTMK